MDKAVHQPLKLMVAIVDRGQGERITESCAAVGATNSMICLGHGTANSHILEILGLGETDKDIVMTVLRGDRAHNVMRQLDEELQLRLPGRGIAFTIPINSVGGPRTLELLSGNMEGGSASC